MKVVKHLSFAEARHVVETAAPPTSGKSYTAVARVSTNNASVQTDLTWPNTEDKFKKVSETEKAQRQAIKASLKQASKMKQVSSEVKVLEKQALASLSQQRTPIMKTRIAVNFKKLKNMQF